MAKRSAAQNKLALESYHRRMTDPVKKKKYQEMRSIWREKNREKLAAYDKICNAEKRAKNAESIREYQHKYRKLKNDEFNKRSSAWRKINRHKCNAFWAKYQADKLKATPAWANDFFIQEIYDLARRRTKCLGIEHDVDHIIPLRSKTVCGLHVENNLRVITAKENRSKGNNYG